MNPCRVCTQGILLSLINVYLGDVITPNIINWQSFNETLAKCLNIINCFVHIDPDITIVMNLLTLQ